MGDLRYVRLPLKAFKSELYVSHSQEGTRLGDEGIFRNIAVNSDALLILVIREGKRELGEAQTS